MMWKKFAVYKDLLIVAATAIVAVTLLVKYILSKSWDGVFLVIFLSTCIICYGFIKNKATLRIVSWVLVAIAIVNLIYHKEIFGS